MGPLRTHDKAIMDIFHNEHDILQKVMASINRVRDCLEVFTLSNIATGIGTKICPYFILGIKSYTKFYGIGMRNALQT